MKTGKNYNLIIGTIITAFVGALVILGFFWTPYDPNGMSGLERMQAPSFAHLLGTDNFGRDIFSRVIEGAGSTLIIAFFTILIGATAGLVIGSVTGYFGGIIDEVLMRMSDVITSFPSFLLALVMISLLGTGKYNVILALAILFIPSFSRIIRTEFVRNRHLDYVESAKLMGASNFRIMYVHILPNTSRTLLSGIAVGFNNAVLAEASMSFLGIGVTPPDPSLGRMLSESQAYLFSAPWYSLSAGVMIALMVLGFALISDGLGDRNHA